MNTTKKINIANNYTSNPGPRFKKLGEFSGEDFRNKSLQKYFLDDKISKIEIFLDGLRGYPSSFFEEAFGGLIRKIYFTEKQNKAELIKKALNKFEFISNNSVRIDEMKYYIKNSLDKID